MVCQQHQQENHDANWTEETKSKGFRAALSAEAWVRGVTDRATAAEVAAGLLPCRIAFLIAEGGREEIKESAKAAPVCLGTERKSFLNPKTVE